MLSPRTVLVRGSGSIGVRHLHALRVLGHNPVAVPVRSERRVALAELGFETAGSIAEAVERGASAAVIATDTSRHVEDASESLAHGRDVLVEKPLAPSASDAEALVRAAALAGRRASVAYCLRFHEGIERFRELLPQIGDVHHVRVACQSFLPTWRPQRDYRESYSARSDEGGALRDLSHEIDYSIWLFGPPLRVQAWLGDGTRLGIEAEDTADLFWTTSSGSTVSVRLDYVTHAPRRTMLAQGADGELEWDAIGETVRVALRGRSPMVVRIAHDRDTMMQRQIEAFLHIVDGGDDDRCCTFDEAACVVRTCDTARRRAQELRARGDEL